VLNLQNHIEIGRHRIGVDHPPFIVAEMSGNHNQSLTRALEIVEAAAHAGVHALKLQTYTAETMTLPFDDDGFLISDEQSLWKGKSLYNLYKEAHTPWEWHKPIFEHCKQLGLLAFSTPFDETAVDFLEELHVPCYKIASFENRDLNLVRKVAATGKPLIVSTGMASVAELDEMVQAARQAGCKDLALLKCTSSYPATPEHSNLRTIPHMRDLFQCEVGLSDHTLGIGVALAAVSLGATVIEKHFTIARSEGGVDAAFSLEPFEMQALVWESKQAWQALGQISYSATPSEKASMAFRRSLYIAKDMQAGEVFTKENLRTIRPGFGLAPKYLDIALGKSVRQDVAAGTPLRWDLIS
jgi:N-acetylneuraminate synthase